MDVLAAWFVETTKWFLICNFYDLWSHRGCALGRTDMALVSKVRSVLGSDAQGTKCPVPDTAVQLVIYKINVVLCSLC